VRHDQCRNPCRIGAEEEALRKLYRETQLVRAHAAVLLKECGCDVTDPAQLAPIL
jgi:hypothetical protein